METPGTSQPSVADNSNLEAASLKTPNFKMIDVGEKLVTRRRAVAKGRIHMAPETVQRIAAKQMPKGDVLAAAEVAGIMAAKNTPGILPLCHHLALDSVRVLCEIDKESISVVCEVICHGKTGVEMEALVGVNAALLCIYDLTKGIDPVLSISDVHLQRKEGGKSGIWRHPRFEVGETPLASETAKKQALFHNLLAASITISDRCSQGEASDASGPLLEDYLRGRGAETKSHSVLADDKEQIKRRVLALVESGVELLLTTGGTGLGPRDVTPEAMREIASRQVEGIGELLRAHGAKYTANSWLSRSEGYLVGRMLVVIFPGSPKAVTQGLEAIGDLLPHAIEMVRGGKHENVRSVGGK